MRVYSNTNNQTKKVVKINQNYLYSYPDVYYKLGQGDRLSIQFEDAPDLTSEHVIDEKGTIYLSELERIYVKDLTTTELKELLVVEYSKYLYDPKIDISILSYRPVRVYIRGEIQNPGYYSVTENTIQNFQPQMRTGDTTRRALPTPTSRINSSKFFPNLFDVIKVSGGITRFADLTDVEITRRGKIANGNKLETLNINFLDMIINQDLTKNIRIFDGDLITIKKSNKPLASQISKSIISDLNPKTISVLVTGRVRRPGRIVIGTQSVLSDAIQVAGGALVIRGKTKLVRANSDGSTSISKFRYRNNFKRGSFKNPNLENGDIIIVGNSALSNTTEFIGEVTNPFRGGYSAYRLFDAIF